jgi:hypothetical protein
MVQSDNATEPYRRESGPNVLAQLRQPLHAPPRGHAEVAKIDRWHTL